MEKKNRVFELRCYLGLSKEQFAKKYHVNLSDIEKWELDFDRPFDYVAMQLAIDAKVPLAFVYGHDYDVTLPEKEWKSFRKEIYDNIIDPENVTAEDKAAKEVVKFKYARGEFKTPAKNPVPVDFALINGSDEYPTEIVIEKIEEYSDFIKKKYDI